MKFVLLNMVATGPYDEDTGVETEIGKPVVINAASVRCFYARKGDKPGTRITFNDGGGFAVVEVPEVVGQALGMDLDWGGDVLSPETGAAA